MFLGFLQDLRIGVANGAIGRARQCDLAIWNQQRAEGAIQIADTILEQLLEIIAVSVIGCAARLEQQREIAVA
jgi:hypothetical protein